MIYNLSRGHISPFVDFHTLETCALNKGVAKILSNKFIISLFCMWKVNNYDKRIVQVRRNHSSSPFLSDVGINLSKLVIYIIVSK